MSKVRFLTLLYFILQFSGLNAIVLHMYLQVPQFFSFLIVILKFSAKSLICSGEPNPPGIEDVPSFLETIGLKHSKPLIGVEYVIELVDNHVSTPTFVCTLCDKRCDPRSILQQLVSHRHRMKYLVRFIIQIQAKTNKNFCRKPIFHQSFEY